MKKKNTAHIILKKSLERIQRTNPMFSIRALSLKVGVSHVFMSKLLKGDVSIPNDKILKLIKILKLDDLSRRELKEAIIQDAISEKLSVFEEKEVILTGEELIVESFSEYPEDFFAVLENWFDLAICDLLTTEDGYNGYYSSALRVSEKLDITESQASESLNKLEELDLISKENGYWEKTQTKLRFPTVSPKEITKAYYLEVLYKIRSILTDGVVEDFQRRSITNLSMAIDSNKVNLAKERIQKFTYSLSKELSSGECDQVYFLTTCFYPVSK